MKSKWFCECVSHCYFYDDYGTYEDMLTQFKKFHGNFLNVYIFQLHNNKTHDIVALYLIFIIFYYKMLLYPRNHKNCSGESYSSVLK